MNEYLKNLSKIEFAVTFACTGRCKHCSEGDHALCGESIDPRLAADAVRRITAHYAIRTVMTFGGEPLLQADTVCAIQAAARDCGVPHRQVITNGYFTRDGARMRAVVRQLAACGVNDLLLSADAFHQETIPLDAVTEFARAVKACGIPIRLSPAWLVSAADENPYNRKTREILAHLRALDLPVCEGNVIFPEGNARKYLADYFTDSVPENPYADDPRDVRCASFSPNGDVLNGNVYRADILDILARYTP
jgi:hypothetical protein